MCSKIRLHAQGKLPKDYHEALGQRFDARTCRYLRVRYEDVRAQVLSGKTDAEVLDWCFANGRRLTEDTYHYIPDVAAGLVALGCAEADVYGRQWMLPYARAETMRELVARFSRKLGREIKLTGVPRWMVKAIGIFVPLVREVGEMLYQ
jgi:hypothetical protein